MHAGLALTRELQEGEAAFEKRFQEVFRSKDDRSGMQQGMHTFCCLKCMPSPRHDSCPEMCRVAAWSTALRVAAEVGELAVQALPRQH